MVSLTGSATRRLRPRVFLGKGRTARLGLRLRDTVSLWWGLAVAVSFGALVSRGFFQDLRSDGGDLVRLSAVGGLGCLLLARIVARLRPETEPEAPIPGWVAAVRDLELGVLVLVSTHVLLQLTGGFSSAVMPLLYAVLTFVVAYTSRPVGLSVVGASVLLEALTRAQTGGFGGSGVREFLAHSGFSVFFGVVGLVLLRVEVAKLRREHSARLAAEIDAIREEARDFRLISASKATSDGRSRDQQEQHLYYGSVESIRQAIYFTLELVKEGLGAQSAVLLWLDERGVQLRVKEMITEEPIADAGLVNVAPFPAVSGVLGGIVKNGRALQMGPVAAGQLPYYRGGVTVGAFLGVPVLEEGHLRGILCVDRAESEPYRVTDRELLEEAAHQVLHTVQAERMFVSIERSKYEQERFFRASERLISALGLPAVYGTAFEAAREIVEFDFGAITLFDPETHRHTLAAVTGDALGEYEGHSFPDNAGLVAMAIKNRHYLPAGGELRDRSQIIFARSIPFPAVESLLVYPLVSGDRALGGFVLAGRKRGLFTAQRREMLGVIANQVAVSVQNGLMYQQMENMATTDGLTGLVNHRTFQGRFDEMLARAQRSGQPVSLVLTDIDHFKSVNDTYGHPVGDAVLKAVARVLQDQARVVDVVARYGGEEFALVLADTDAQGAFIVAERIREQVGALVHQSDQGPFSCTLSLGIASFPADGTDKKLLIERADQGLYWAKEHGRNQSVRFQDIG